MAELSVEPDGLRSYAAKAASMAEQVAGQGAMDVAESVGALGPVFGLIGGDFLAAFGAAQSSHLESIAELAGVFGAASSTALASAESYEEADRAHADSLSAIGGSL